MKKLGTMAAASAMAITTVWTAAADENHGTSFPVSAECAESALRKVFEIGAEDIVVATPEGVAVSRHLVMPNGGEVVLRGQVNLLEGYVAGTIVETEMKKPGSDFDFHGSFLRSYGVERKPPESITSGSNMLDDTNQILSNHVDRALRECSQPQIMSGLLPRPPFMG